jgi:hypothetical protein
MFGLESNDYISDRNTMYICDYNYNIISGIDHTGFKFNWVSINDDMRQYPEHYYCIISPLGQH